MPSNTSENSMQDSLKRFEKHDSGAKENAIHSSVMHPFSYYECRLPDAYPNVPIHWHHEFELNVVISGTGDIICNNQSFVVKAGDVVLIPPDTLHGAFPANGEHLFYDAFVFHHAMLGTSSRDRSSSQCIMPVVHGEQTYYPLIDDRLQSYPMLFSCASEVLSFAKKDDANSDLMLKSRLLELFYLLSGEPSLQQNEERPSSLPGFIRTSLDYMEQHLGEHLTIGAMAKRCHVSSSYYMSCFKRATGISTMEYLNQIRIRHACDLLLGESSMSVADVALNCGFDNLSNFNRQFKKVVGRTPREYRRDKSQ